VSIYHRDQSSFVFIGFYFNDSTLLQSKQTFNSRDRPCQLSLVCFSKSVIDYSIIEEGSPTLKVHQDTIETIHLGIIIHDPKI